jgi:hypothetical protein
MAAIAWCICTTFSAVQASNVSCNPLVKVLAALRYVTDTHAQGEVVTRVGEG